MLKKQLSVNHEDVVDVQKTTRWIEFGWNVEGCKAHRTNDRFHHVVPIATPTECLPESSDHA